MIILRILLSALLVLSAAGQDTLKRVSIKDNGNLHSLPIVLPPYVYEDVQTIDDSCLLYIESVSVVAYNQGSTRGFTSAAAIFDHLNGKFKVKSVQCLKMDSKNRTFSFHMSIISSDEVVAKDNNEELFSVSGGIEFKLNFKANHDLSWRLTDVELPEGITLMPKEWIVEKLNVPPGKKSDNADRIYFGGYNDYSYACSDSPAVVWPLENEGKVVKDHAVGLVFNNIQLQAFGIIAKEDEQSKKVYRFSTNVNDCHGAFSVGSWMAIVVILLLLSVLSFGFLMLNSVQTMDRFDDPKQKQLIINAKE